MIERVVESKVTHFPRLRYMWQSYFCVSEVALYIVFVFVLICEIVCQHLKSDNTDMALSVSDCVSVSSIIHKYLSLCFTCITYVCVCCA